jgi:hypothetical protein
MERAKFLNTIVILFGPSFGILFQIKKITGLNPFSGYAIGFIRFPDR